MEAIVYILVGLMTGIMGTFMFTASRRKVMEDELTTLKLDLKEMQTRLSAEKERASQEVALLREQNDSEKKLRQQQFEQQLKTVQEQFANLANKVLSQTSDQLKTQNAESMKTVTAPLQLHLEQLQKAIQNTNSESAKNTASLSQQLKEMAEQNARINTTATRLTNVIRGGNKAQGNWGERMLVEILEAQGFRQGFDYDVQESIIDEESGRRLIPDVVLHYPNNEDVIIDSKMSIDAYYQYVNTDDETLKRKFADDLVKSIRAQMNGLSRKDYSRYVKTPRRAIEFVIMFVPNEGALQLALETDLKLWAEAFEKQVFITSQQNLMAILRIIQIAWRQYAQTENQKRVFDLAEELLKRMGEFIKRFDRVGKDIDSLRKDYDDAYNKAYTGRQSIVQKANELKDLGVKESTNHPIPQPISDFSSSKSLQEECE